MREHVIGCLAGLGEARSTIDYSRKRILAPSDIMILRISAISIDGTICCQSHSWW